MAGVRRVLRLLLELVEVVEAVQRLEGRRRGVVGGQARGLDGAYLVAGEVVAVHRLDPAGRVQTPTAQNELTEAVPDLLRRLLHAANGAGPVGADLLAVDVVGEPDGPQLPGDRRGLGLDREQAGGAEG
jgi:hypothetical protein